MIVPVALLMALPPWQAVSLLLKEEGPDPAPVLAAVLPLLPPPPRLPRPDRYSAVDWVRHPPGGKGLELSITHVNPLAGKPFGKLYTLAISGQGTGLHGQIMVWKDGARWVFEVVQAGLSVYPHYQVRGEGAMVGGQLVVVGVYQDWSNSVPMGGAVWERRGGAWERVQCIYDDTHEAAGNTPLSLDSSGNLKPIKVWHREYPSGMTSSHAALHMTEEQTWTLQNGRLKASNPTILHNASAALSELSGAVRDGRPQISHMLTQNRQILERFKSLYKAELQWRAVGDRERTATTFERDDGLRASFRRIDGIWKLTQLRRR